MVGRVHPIPMWQRAVIVLSGTVVGLVIVLGLHWGRPVLIPIASLPPGGLAHARYLCKRLRGAAPEIEIIVGRWGLQRNSKLDRERLELAGASFVTTTLLETQKLLKSRRPLLTRKRSTTDIAELRASITMPGGR